MSRPAEKALHLAIDCGPGPACSAICLHNLKIVLLVALDEILHTRGSNVECGREPLVSPSYLIIVTAAAKIQGDDSPLNIHAQGLLILMRAWLAQTLGHE